MLKYLSILFLTVSIIISASSAEAFIAEGSLLDGFSGWTQLSDCADCDSIVNFSVYESYDNDWTDNLFFSNVSSITNQYKSLDTTAKYIYMYQIVNVDPDISDEEPIGKYAVRQNEIYTSGGYFTGTVFDDSTAQIDAANWSLSDPDPAFPGDDPIDWNSGLGDGQPSATVDTANVSLTADMTNAIKNPLSLQAVTGGCPGPEADCGVMAWNFTYITEEINHNILTDEYSSVLFLTSNSAPMYHFSETEAVQGTGADGEVPTTVPEPISTILFLTGGVALGARRWRK